MLKEIVISILLLIFLSQSYKRPIEQHKEAYKKDPEIVEIEEDAHEISETNDNQLDESDDWLPKIVDISDEEIKWLSTMVYYESKYCPDRHQQLTAMSAINRMRAKGKLGINFNNWYELLSKQGGYVDIYHTEDAYQKAIEEDYEEYERCMRNAQMALHGFCECPITMIFAAQFKQGIEVYEVSEITTSGGYHSITYFCLADERLFDEIEHW